jgi:hypothetical protein
VSYSKYSTLTLIHKTEHYHQPQFSSKHSLTYLQKNPQFYLSVPKATAN